jgi:hypothetical protein
MRDFLNSGCRWLRTGWFFAFVLLALPNCGLNTRGNHVGEPQGDCQPEEECPAPCEPPDPECPSVPPKAFEPGPNATNAIMCDISKPEDEDVDYCATQAEIDDDVNISNTQAATALSTGKTRSFVLDWSDASLNECGGKPKKIEMFGPYPQGLTLCLNCGSQIPSVYATPVKACIAKCKDLVNAGTIPAEGTDAFCLANTKTSTNYDKDICYEGVCDNGTPLPPGSFIDPRLTQEPVKWVDHIGTDDTGVDNNTLTRIAPTTGQTIADFNAGAASAQTILSGDAWIEFGAPEVDRDRVLSVRASCADASNCPDADPSLDAFGFGLDMNLDGQVYVVESAPALMIFGPFGPYTPTERYRVRVRDNHNGTATISYSRIVGVCAPGTECTEDVFFTSVATPPYPLRVDTSFHLQGGTLSNVTIVRIKQ